MEVAEFSVRVSHCPDALGQGRAGHLHAWSQKPSTLSPSLTTDHALLARKDSPLALVALIAYDADVRHRLFDRGATREETQRELPGDDVPADFATHHT